MRVLVMALSCFVAAGTFASFANAETETKREKEQRLLQEASLRLEGMTSVVQALADSSLECDDVDDCMSAPMGSRACGGPNTFVVTSKKNPSLKGLMHAIDLVTEAEADLNQKFGMMSICSVEMPPSLHCIAKTCKAEH